MQTNSSCRMFFIHESKSRKVERCTSNPFIYETKLWSKSWEKYEKESIWCTIILLLSFYLKWRWISFLQPMLSSLLNISSPPNLNIDVSLNQDCPDIISPFSWFFHFGERGVGKGTTKVVVAENQIISWWYLYNYLSELSWYHLPISLQVWNWFYHFVERERGAWRTTKVPRKLQLWWDWEVLFSRHSLGNSFDISAESFLYHFPVICKLAKSAYLRSNNCFLWI